MTSLSRSYYGIREQIFLLRHKIMTHLQIDVGAWIKGAIDRVQGDIDVGQGVQKLGQNRGGVGVFPRRDTHASDGRLCHAIAHQHQPLPNHPRQSETTEKHIHFPENKKLLATTCSFQS